MTSRFRLWIPRSPLWLPAMVILLCALVYGTYYFPHTVDPKSFTLPRDRIVAGSYVHPETWPPVPTDERVFVHSVFGTEVFEHSSGRLTGVPRIDGNSQAQPLVTGEGPAVLSPNLTLEPLLIGSGHGGFEGDFVFHDLANGQMISLSDAAAKVGMASEKLVSSDIWTGWPWGNIFLAMRFSAPPSVQNPMWAFLHDSRTGARIGGVLDIYTADLGDNGSIVLFVAERPLYALGDLSIVVGWQDGCAKSFEMAPLVDGPRVEYEPGRFSPTIVYFASVPPRTLNVSSRARGAELNTYIRIKSMLGDMRVLPKVVLKNGTEVNGVNVGTELMWGPVSSRTVTLDYPVRPGDIRAIRFNYRCPRLVTMTRLPSSAGAQYIAAAEWDIMSHPIPDEIGQLSIDAPFALMNILHSTDVSQDARIANPEAPKLDEKRLRVTRDYVTEFFRLNRHVEIIQDYDAIRFAPRGTAYLSRHPWLEFLVGNRTIPRAAVRYTLYILFGWLLWAIIQSVWVARDLRRKNYSNLSIGRLILLYLTTGSALRHLPSRDEAAALPEVNVESWWSLRRFVIAQAMRK